MSEKGAIRRRRKKGMVPPRIKNGRGRDAITP